MCSAAFAHSKYALKRLTTSTVRSELYRFYSITLRSQLSQRGEQASLVLACQCQ